MPDVMRSVLIAGRSVTVRIVEGRNFRESEKKPRAPISNREQGEIGSRISKLKSTPSAVILARLIQKGLREGLQVLLKPGYQNAVRRATVDDIDISNSAILLTDEWGGTHELEHWRMEEHIIMPSDSRYQTHLDEYEKREVKALPKSPTQHKTVAERHSEFEEECRLYGIVRDGVISTPLGQAKVQGFNGVKRTIRAKPPFDYERSFPLDVILDLKKK